MKNNTKMRIKTTAKEVFESFVDPERIGNFWFSSSSERWGQGKTVTLTYNELNAAGDIHISSIIENEKIEFEWGAGHTVTILFHEIGQDTIVEITEEGFNKNDENILEQMVDHKEGWVFMLTCLKAYLENGTTTLRTGLVK